MDKSKLKAYIKSLVSNVFFSNYDGQYSSLRNSLGSNG